MSSVLTHTKNEKKGVKKINPFSEYIKVIMKDGLEVLPPDINLSEEKCVAEGKKAIRLSFDKIKGIGIEAAKYLVENQPFNELEDLFDGKLDGRKCGKKVILALAKVGALDSLFCNRKGLVDFIESYYSNNSKPQRKSKLKQVDKYLDVVELSELELLELSYSVIESYLNKHPFDQYEKIVKDYNKKVKGTEKRSIILPSTLGKKTSGYLSGMVKQAVVRKTTRGGRMQVITLEDKIANVEFILWDDQIKKYNKIFEKSDVIIIKFKRNLKYNTLSLDTGDITKTPIALLEEFTD